VTAARRPLAGCAVPFEVRRNRSAHVPRRDVITGCLRETGLSWPRKKRHSGGLISRAGRSDRSLCFGSKGTLAVQPMR